MGEYRAPKPDIEEIEELLTSFRPNPSRSFHQKMQSAPWKQDTVHRGYLQPWLAVAVHSRKWQTAAVLLLLALVMVAFFTLQDLPAMAQNLLRYLRPASSDQIAVPVRIPYPEEADTFGSPRYFSLDLEQAEREAGFEPARITAGEFDLSFSGAHYDADLHRVVSRYMGDEFTLYYSQRRLLNIEEYSQIGASAPVEIVRVRGADGEFVSGGWKMEAESQLMLATSSPGTQINLSAYWDETLPQQVLRWQEAGFLYEILAVGDASLKKEDLIFLAESVK